MLSGTKKYPIKWVGFPLVINKVPNKQNNKVLNVNIFFLIIITLFSYTALILYKINKKAIVEMGINTYCAGLMLTLKRKMVFILS